MKTKQRMRLEIKDISADGTFEGILSPYGNVDGGNDVVEAGAYAKTLKDQGNTRPMLWQHKSDTPIGQLTLEDRADGLWCKGQLLLADSMAQRAYLFIKAGIVKGLSIGFESVKDAVEGGVRHLKEIKLYEGSIVTFPMNEMALITSVKRIGESKDDFNEELSDIQLMDAGWQAFCALQCALGSILWASGMDKPEKLAAASAYIQQFTDYYLGYLPAFLDMLAEDYGGMEMMAARTALEKKSGRMISAANKQSLKTALDHPSSLQTIISALVDEEAGGDSTPKGAAEPTTLEPQAAEHKSEPIIDHSALSQILTKAKEFNGTRNQATN